MSGTITGGGAATGNTLTARDVANTWAINAADAGSVTNVNAFTGVGNLTGGTDTDSFTLSGTGSVSGTITGGGAATGNTLTARDVANAWAINAADAGSVTNVNAFTGVGNLTGGTNTDSFTLSGTGSVSGTITGGGAATGNTLTARDVANTWNLTANDAGSVTNNVNAFTGVGNLVGGSNTDAFVFTDAVVMSGTINGAGGSDTLNLGSYTTARSVVINATSTADGFAGTEASVTGGFSGINVVTLPAGTVNSLQGADFANSWAITTLNAGTLTENGNVLTFWGRTI